MAYPSRMAEPGESAKIMGQSSGIVGMNFGKGPKLDSNASSDQGHLFSDSSSGIQQVVDPVSREASELMSGEYPSGEKEIDSAVIEAYKRGDRIGSPFEGGTPFKSVNEARLQMALKNSQGTDESSIVDCFLAYVERHPWAGDLDFWLWGWLVYHQEHHGTGYGRTMRDHFALVSFLVKRRQHLSFQQKLAKVREIAADADSFGNGALCLVYPLYRYARSGISELPAREVVMGFTRCTHTNEDAVKAVILLMDFIDGADVEPPTEACIREHYFAEHATAYNTLMTAMYIADAGTEMDVIRRGVYVGGDTDSTLATAMLLWKLKDGRRLISHKEAHHEQ